ncbi:unnamed protein product [Caenorhabditis auriculariae]|uniref:Uncharacterized protein n=1 Tax=Caenorhabditis auriculariae TaxID=2777116 RepID=A0A8S1H244_9PELO|nr:unnamed protein product [Caenorhabditis auriculariae]
MVPSSPGRIISFLPPEWSVFISALVRDSIRRPSALDKLGAVLFLHGEAVIVGNARKTSTTSTREARCSTRRLRLINDIIANRQTTLQSFHDSAENLL